MSRHIRSEQLQRLGEEISGVLVYLAGLQRSAESDDERAALGDMRARLLRVRDLAQTIRTE